MKLWTSLLVAAALLIATPQLATAGMKYMDKAPLIVKVQHRLLTERLQARRDRIFEQRREERRAARRAAAAAQVGPTPTQPTPVVSYTGGWADALRAAGFPEYAIPQMLYYIDRESGGNPSAINSSSGACGLLQLYPCPGPEALDPMTNLRMAYAKFRAAGFSPWGG